MPYPVAAARNRNFNPPEEGGEGDWYWQTPDYGHSGGQGVRTSEITVTISGGYSGTTSELVNGLSGNTLYFTGGSVAGISVKFDFGSQRIITEAVWYQDASNTHGTWKWQGSNNDSDWTDIGSSFTLGGTAQTHAELAGNETAYRYYRLLGVSGNSSSTPWLREINFKIAGYVQEGTATSYAYSGGRGDRTAIITISTDYTWYGGISNIIDGTYNNEAYMHAVAALDHYIKFDFGSVKKIVEAKWLQGYSGNTHGTWKWQGSNNDSDWTDIGSSFTLGGWTQYQAELAGNTTYYRYYRLLGVSGNTSGTPYIVEIEFKIGSLTE